MKENTGVTTFKGVPITLLGEQLRVGDIFPEGVKVVDASLQIKLIDEFKGKKIVISTFPSIDTPVCAIQTRYFYKIASELGEDVVILNISRDLPFALSRFCAAEGLNNVIMLSDYRDGEFGCKTGLMMKELMLLARGVLILDKSGKIVYQEIVKEQANEPDYEKALDALKKI